MPVPGTMVHTILNTALQFFQDTKNRQRIQTQCIDPILNHILDRVFPYIILICIIFSLILLMSFISIALLVFQLRVTSTAAIATKAIATAAIAPVIIPSLV